MAGWKKSIQGKQGRKGICAVVYPRKFQVCINTEQQMWKRNRRKGHGTWWHTRMKTREVWGRLSWEINWHIWHRVSKTWRDLESEAARIALGPIFRADVSLGQWKWLLTRMQQLSSARNTVRAQYCSKCCTGVICLDDTVKPWNRLVLFSVCS